MTTLCGLPGACVVGPPHDRGEGTALTAVVAALEAEGSTVIVECSPDLRPKCLWTNDWIVRVEGVPWLIEHTALAFSDKTQSRMDTADKLQELIDELGAKHSVQIVVGISPEMDGDALPARVARKFRKAAWKALRAWVTHTVENLDPWAPGETDRFFEGELDATIDVRPLDLATVDPDEPGVYGYVLSFLANSANTSEQFAITNEPILRRKLSKQILKVAGVVEHAGLVIDRADLEGHANWIVSAEVVRQRVVILLREFPEALDRLWLLESDGALVELDLTRELPPGM
jgi:hypothetical protein